MGLEASPAVCARLRPATDRPAAPRPAEPRAGDAVASLWVHQGAGGAEPAQVTRQAGGAEPAEMTRQAGDAPAPSGLHTSDYSCAADARRAAAARVFPSDRGTELLAVRNSSSSATILPGVCAIVGRPPRPGAVTHQITFSIKLCGVCSTVPVHAAVPYRTVQWVRFSLGTVSAHSLNELGERLSAAAATCVKSAVPSTTPPHGRRWEEKNWPSVWRQQPPPANGRERGDGRTVVGSSIHVCCKTRRDGKRRRPQGARHTSRH